MFDYPGPVVMPSGQEDPFMWVGPWPGGMGGATTNEMTLIMEGRGGRGGYGPNITWYPPGAPVMDDWPPRDPVTGMRYVPKPRNYPMGPYGAPTDIIQNGDDNGTQKSGNEPSQQTTQDRPVYDMNLAYGMVGSLVVGIALCSVIGYFMSRKK